MFVRLMSSLAPVGPLNKRTCFKISGSIDGTLISGIPVVSLSRSCSIELNTHLFISGSFRLHTFMYDAVEMQDTNLQIFFTKFTFLLNNLYKISETCNREKR